MFSRLINIKKDSIDFLRHDLKLRLIQMIV